MLRMVPLDWSLILFPAMIGMLFGAVLLLAAIALLNKLAGGAGAPGSVAPPSFVKAMGITFTIALINAAVGIGVASAFQATPAIQYIPAGGYGVLAQVVALPLSLLIMVAMLTVMLPTNLGRAVVITLLFLSIAIALTLLIAGVLAFGVLVIRIAIP